MNGTDMNDSKSVKVINKSGPWGFTLFLGFIGALVYFISIADGFWEVILAILKSFVWPAFIVYYSLQGLGVG